MSELRWKQGDAVLYAFERELLVSNKVYEPVTQTPAEHVVRTTNEDGSDGVPYKPKAFPVGVWSVYTPLARTSMYTAPYFIPTNACQLVEEWTLDEHGLYQYPAGRTVMDYGYGLHHSAIEYTFGCLRIVNVPDLLWLVERLKQEGLVHMEVT